MYYFATYSIVQLLIRFCVEPWQPMRNHSELMSAAVETTSKTHSEACKSLVQWGQVSKRFTGLFRWSDQGKVGSMLPCSLI